MKTEQLIELLARQAGPAPRAPAARRLAPAVAAGLLASAVAAVAVFGTIPAAMLGTPAPWIKFGYGAALMAAAGWLTARLARPAAPTGPVARAAAAVVLLMLGLGAATLVATAPGSRWAELLGHSWAACPWNVLVLSLPGLAAVLWALRGLAPTRPRAAGLAAGLLAGAAGALGYSLSCPEASPAFVAAWYTLGIGLTAAVGAALGPRVLRW
jgi:hypothetical protein